MGSVHRDKESVTAPLRESREAPLRYLNSVSHGSAACCGIVVEDFVGSWVRGS